RSRERRERLPAERPHRRSEPPRDHAARAAARARAGLPAARTGPPLEALARPAARLPADRGARDALAQRAARPRVRRAAARDPVPALRLVALAALAGGRCRRPARGGRLEPQALL